MLSPPSHAARLIPALYKRTYEPVQILFTAVQPFSTCLITNLISQRTFERHQGSQDVRSRTHPEVIAARRQDGFVGVELLLAGDQGDVTQQAVLPLLVEGGQDRVLVGL